ncbi:MAG: PD-(D/E)XK nuclease-like domain-containing protein, partial [Rubrivivax sp.]|nr:PD-(D/E)XK nuclease-like domain-containing protein [Rubrivivax sp.]
EPARFAADYCRAPDPAEHPAALLDHAAFKARARDLGLKVTGTKAELKARILEADPEVLFWEDHAQGLVEGREALKADHWHLAQAVLASVGGNDKARAALTGGVAEETLVWLDGPTGLLAKARLDYYREDLGVVFDVKTTEDARPFAVERDLVKWGYHLSAAHYLAGLRARGLPGDSFAWIFIEKAAPHAMGLYFASPALLDTAEGQRRRLLDAYAACQTSGVWPGYPGEFQTIDLPVWARD